MQADLPASKIHFENNLAENEHLGVHSPDKLREPETQEASIKVHVADQLLNKL